MIAEEAGPLRGAASSRARPSRAGDPVGRLWFPDTPGPRAGGARARRSTASLAVIRAIPVTEPGDSVFSLGQPIEAEALL